jgi:predicted ribonuclease YlaK
MRTYKFYDTSSLLLKASSLFEDGELFAISSITLNELENIKTSSHKDAEVKYAARKLLHALDEHRGEYDIQIYHPGYLAPIEEKDLEITNDMKILACALAYDRESHPDETVFVTNDVALKAIANLFFGEDSIESVNEDYDDEYSGYKELHLSEEELIEFYSNPTENLYDLHINEYILIYNDEGKNVERLCWTGEGYRHLNYSNFKSKNFGDIKPLPGDAYQSLAADSLSNNKITMLKGPAGSGKTLLALGYLFNRLDRGKIDKIIVFCNTVATKGSAKLGFLPGTRDEKLLDSQIGILLSSKLGDKMEVERLIADGKLVLLPMSDIRGFDTTNMHAGIYISEAQNLDIALMKLALQRIGEDSVCIIDGDCKAQVDDISFAGSNNGMRRASKVFRGTDVYGEVELKHIHRSKIAAIAEQM